MTKFACFGDSYMSRLESFSSGNMPCRFFGESGMSSTRKFKDKFHQLLEFRPDVVFMNIGGNDINARSSVEAIFLRIKNVVEELR